MKRRDFITLLGGAARPGGNVTGLSLQQTDLGSKRLELVHEIVPGLRRLAIIGNLSNPGVPLEIGEVRAAANGLGVDVTTFDIRRAELRFLQHFINTFPQTAHSNSAFPRIFFSKNFHRLIPLCPSATFGQWVPFYTDAHGVSDHII